MDTDEGNGTDPASLHKYLYASGNPVNRTDPSGNDDFDMASISDSLGGLGTIFAMAEYLGFGPTNCKLSYVTVHGGPTAWEWDIAWKLSAPSVLGGSIVQQVWIYTDANQTKLKQTYWEAWSVGPAMTITVNAELGAASDDTSRGIHGERIDFCAVYYQGLLGAGLEAHGFAPEKVDEAGNLLSTPDDPNLPQANPDDKVWRTHNIP